MIERGIAAPLAAALEAKGYAALTPVQEAVLAPEVAGRDLLVSAQTGSGKTVAFGIAFADELLRGADRLLFADVPMALIIAPTRELALQVARELDWLYAETGAQIATCVGGMDYRTEKRALDRGAHIVVGTPGRLRDHIERRSLDLSGLRVAVLDEADEMLDLGFREDLEFILQAAPEERRTLMFSATVPKAIAELAKDFQRDALRLQTAGEARQHVDIEYRALNVSARDREHAIFNLLRFYEARSAIVFCKTRANVNNLIARMGNRGFQVVALSGELSQQERTHALQALRDGRARVYIATDVAAKAAWRPGRTDRVEREGHVVQRRGA
ncbi:MAG: DEAD/DEAH box helicase, partial [Paracoccaceae bacterium]|nr:DEAD/DEAH box helicase [Paracoccaceae bacterium]